MRVLFLLAWTYTEVVKYYANSYTKNYSGLFTIACNSFDVHSHYDYKNKPI